MKKSLYSSEISPKCEYCANGKITPEGKEVICYKRGVMQVDSFCRKFRYDPLKRKPKQVTVAADYSPEDFAL